MKRAVFVLIGILFVFTGFVFAQEEKLTIATYYPSPYGVYNEMRFFPHGQQTNCTLQQEGLSYFDSNEHILKVCACPGGDATKCEWSAVPGGGGGASECINVVSDVPAGNCLGCVHLLAKCPAGYKVQSGGASCGKWLNYVVASEMNEAENAWYAACRGSCTTNNCAYRNWMTRATARCCK